MPNIIRIGGGSKKLNLSATASEVLATKTFSVNGKNILYGTMPNLGTQNATLGAGEEYLIPRGYHDGSGKVAATELVHQTSGTASSEQILSGKTAWVNGVKLTGGMADRGAVVQSLAINSYYTIPQGYHNGQGKVSQSIETVGANTYTPKTTDQTISAGKYLTGVQTIKGDTNLVPENVMGGKTLFGVNGTGCGLIECLGIVKFSMKFVLDKDAVLDVPMSNYGQTSAENIFLAFFLDDASSNYYTDKFKSIIKGTDKITITYYGGGATTVTEDVYIAAFKVTGFKSVTQGFFNGITEKEFTYTGVNIPIIVAPEDSRETSWTEIAKTITPATKKIKFVYSGKDNSNPSISFAYFMAQ